MANWKRTIKIGDILHPEGNNGDTPPRVAARALADRLKVIDFKNVEANYERDELVEQFEELANDTETSYDELQDGFNSVLNDLYDFGDSGHKFWVDTFESGVTLH